MVTKPDEPVTSGSAAAVRPAAPRRRYDIEDREEEIPQREPLRTALRLANELIAPAYGRASSTATRHHRNHRRIVAVIASFWTAALLFTIVQLSGMFTGPLMQFGEILTTIVSLIVVILGVFVSGQRGWLSERHKAERLRALKFRFLTDPRLLSNDQAVVQERMDRLRQQVEAIDNLTTAEMERFAEADDIPTEPPDRVPEGIDRTTLDELIAYYRDKRLDFQRRFFRNQMQRHAASDRYTRLLPPFLFFGTIIITLAHYLYDYLDDLFGDGGKSSDLSLAIVVIAASMPVIGAGVRTFRSAQEDTRNIGRYRSKLIALDSIDTTIVPGADPHDVYHGFWYAELVLDAEHRDWLRLMTGVEWIG